ncbi:MAG: hypothetical protein IKS01_02920 [Paludibacteraceae bacterium]|nr:hypothetical protein [Paludibacteraceae bacterium]
MKTFLVIIVIIASAFFALLLVAAIKGFKTNHFATREELRAKFSELNEVAKSEYQKREAGKNDCQKQRSGLFHFLSYPSPLNNWGLWH